MLNGGGGAYWRNLGDDPFLFSAQMMTREKSRSCRIIRSFFLGHLFGFLARTMGAIPPLTVSYSLPNSR